MIDAASPADTTAPTAEYRVLARKYRPQTFEDLVGQDTLVRTLRNAFAQNRIHHAFVLTGVRGVGKTTTARIVAKGLNCTGPDGTGGPTMTPCGVCDHCRAIAEDRHVDVLEMDAASRTGVDDVREIIESVRYRPASARYKIYIVDEVHMLSRNAFNALLKTLEEPPEHVKFIFATTEIRKVPITVLSRCQRFDLKRVEADVLIAHLAKLVDQEGCKAEEGALKLIARAAEGSVRDSLSLLDQAIAHGAGEVTEGQVRDMLGLADRALVLDLFEQLMKGDVATSLATLRKQYDAGADPAVVLNDLLEVTHWLTRLKVTPDTGTDTLVSEAERKQGGEMAAKLGMPHLTRAWQMLLKGLGEVKTAPSPIAAAEMVLIRLCYAANLPSPADLVKQVQGGGGAPAGGPAGGPGGGGGNVHAMASQQAPQAYGGGAPTAAHSAQVLAFRQDAGQGADHPKHPMPVDFEKLVALFNIEKEPTLAVLLKDHVRLVTYKPGSISFRTLRQLPPDFMMRVKSCLKLWTGVDWQIAVTREEEGEETIRTKEIVREKKRRDEALAEPIVKSLLAAFPDAELIHVRDSRAEEDEVPSMDDALEGVSFDDDMGDGSDFDF